MQIKHLALLSFVLLPITVFSATNPEQPLEDKGYPGEVSLMDYLDGESKYIQFKTSLPLYVYKKDAPGKSNCTGGCAHAWPPLVPDENSTPIGDWTILQREDGMKQWVYKGQPVYRHYHDSANDPQGYRPSEGWYYLVP